jgi:hypothetical protein
MTHENGTLRRNRTPVVGFGIQGPATRPSVSMNARDPAGVQFFYLSGQWIASVGGVK